MLLALLLQATPVTSASAAPPRSFSVLYAPCAPAAGKDVVVCGRGADERRLPLPDDAPPTPGYVKPDSGDYRDNVMGGTPCVARMEGCRSMVGVSLLSLGMKAAHALQGAHQRGRWAAARARDGAAREAIDLSETGPTGSVVP